MQQITARAKKIFDQYTQQDRILERFYIILEDLAILNTELEFPINLVGLKCAFCILSERSGAVKRRYAL